MPVKLIGPSVKFSGKTLWEIVGNLKNFGVGRIVYKNHFVLYPEPSYYKIVKVQAVETPKNKYENRQVMVWAEHVFRGKKYPELIKMHDRTYKPQFRLIPRSEEHKYLNAELKERVKEIPEVREWPPVMKILLEREAVAKGSKDLPILRTKLSSGPNVVAVTSPSKSADTMKPPALYMDYTVAELKQKLESLKFKAEPAAS